MATQSEGTVYLLHFSEPYKHARHYLGWSTNLDKRLDSHRKGRGSRLVQVIRKVGITWTLTRTWPGDRHFERKLKNRKNARFLCPECQSLHRIGL
jgi:predicted GIY-YIG superfamily endonuclease